MNKLFVVCPFSFMENYIRDKYGKDVFFLTAVGGILHYEEYEYMIALRDFLEREAIDSIYFVNDTSCRFINGILKKEKLRGFPAEKIIEEIYINHYTSKFRDKPLVNQQHKLAELNVSVQATELLDSTILGNFICNNGIEVNGLITSKEKSFFKEITTQQKLEYIYEF